MPIPPSANLLPAILVLLIMTVYASLTTPQPNDTYTWTSQNRKTTIQFNCDANTLAVHIYDPQRTAQGHTYPIDITAAVSYSHVLGTHRDWRITYHETFDGNRVTMSDAQQFARDLGALHHQEIDNRKMLKAEYDYAVRRCDNMPTENDRNACFHALTPAVYFTSQHPSLTVNLNHHRTLDPEEGFHAARTLSAFNSEELLENLDRLTCYAPN